MMRTILSRLRGRGGYTLTELMLTTLILLLVAGVVGAGIPAAANSYKKAVDAANAQVLLSTTLTELRDEIGIARDPNSITCPSGTSIVFTDSYWQKNTIASSGDIELGITINDKPLVSKTTATSNLYTVFEGVECADGTVTFTNVAVLKADDTPVVTVDSYKIKLVNYVPEG